MRNILHNAAKTIFPGFIYIPLKKGYFYILFIADYLLFKRKNNNRFIVGWKNRYPCLADKTSVTGFDKHYIYHPAWAARILAQTKSPKHIDISSTLYFCTLVSAFVPVEFYDYRPANLQLPNLSSKQGDLMHLPFADNSIESISCMHTVEHVGLGRYGDPLDPDGDLKAIKELKRVLAVGGSLLFVVPVGKPKIALNAHRIYSYEQIMEYFSDLKLKEFCLISEKDQNSGLIYNATASHVAEENYGCGCFWFTK
jgi:SAM-dependent methyltransferase